MYHNGHQVRFEILGNPPIKNNYIAIYDFRMRRIAVIDSTLKNNGKYLICFMMNMNISTMPDRYALEIGAQNAFKRTEQIHGWEEAWNFLPTSYFGNSSALFEPPISECDGARWILLNYTKSDQRGQKCSDCYDFCLPELGIERDYLRAETFLNIIRRSCFYLFVPEWRDFATAHSGKQNQYNFEQFYYQGLSHTSSGNDSNNYGNHFNEMQNVIDGIAHPITSDQYRNFESKWISLQKIPQQISNPTNQAMDQMNSNIASNAPNFPLSAAQSIFGNRNYQQPNAEDSYTGNMPSSIYSNFNLNSNNNNDFNNDQIRNEFENTKSDFSNNNDRMKPLLLMPPPSYPIQIKQSLDHTDSHTYQNFGGGNVRQQNVPFDGINNIGQFALPTKYNGQPNSLNGQLTSGQTSDGLPNAMNIDSKDSQSKSIYDQSIMNISSYSENISKQSNYYTSQPGIDIYMQQAAANPKQNDPDNGSGIQQSVNDQEWITVG
ncbi:unnamed protein product [Onchocerca flexuosa]|uniref:C-SKI_SMAD_bind domain-containing protein n=1 Tax=Onchocerca flexuosa TaxID=387005 RepID=A0A183HZG5_9BILA|nr:unnamed protein product [Onchocerca flexuosa]